MKNILISGVVIALLTVGMSYALDKQEQHECYKWQAQAVANPAYYFTTWQLEQCSRWDIDLTYNPERHKSYSGGIWRDSEGNITGYSLAEDSFITNK